MAAYQRDEQLRHAEERRLAKQVDSHTSTEHRLVAMAIAVLLVMALFVVSNRTKLDTGWGRVVPPGSADRSPGRRFLMS